MAKARLGKGLNALLPPSQGGGGKARGGSGSSVARIEDLKPNKAQPRTYFDDDALEELAASIKELGVLEPILVRTKKRGGYEIIAGERRWRAAQRAGLREVPIFVRELSDKQTFEAAIVENLQREDLNPVETARSFQRLIDDHKHSPESVGKLVGKSRSAIANAIRLLKLPEDVQSRLESGELSEGHGRALLGAERASTIRKLANQAVKKQWSVRETERQARSAQAPAKSKSTKSKSANVRALERRLSDKLGTTVTVEQTGKNKGHVAVRYDSLDQLDEVLRRLGVL